MGERRGTKGLELWCRRMTEGYPGVNVKNMTTSWRDGLAFCAIIHHFRPDLIDFSKLDKEDVYHNNELAFRVAEHHLGIPALLEPEDMVEFPVPDRLSILTYLSQFYQTFAVAQGKSPARIAPKRAAPSTDHGIVSPASTSPPTKVVAPMGKIRREPCAKCGLPVFIAERLNVGKLLFHRTCFRCARCKSQLTLANYYETENQDFCCETCPDEEDSTSAAVAVGAEAAAVLTRSLSDEEKSASLKKSQSLDDEYSARFENALENPKDASLKKSSTLSQSQFLKAKTFFMSQVEAEDSNSDSGEKPPDLPKSKPPVAVEVLFTKPQQKTETNKSDFPTASDGNSKKLPEVISDNDSVISISSDSANNSSLFDVKIEKSHDDSVVTKETIPAEGDSKSSLVKARMRLFEANKKSDEEEIVISDTNNSRNSEISTTVSKTSEEEETPEKTHSFSLSKNASSSDLERSEVDDSQIVVVKDVSPSIPQQEAIVRQISNHEEEIIIISDSDDSHSKSIKSPELAVAVEYPEDLNPFDAEVTNTSSNPFESEDEEDLAEKIVEKPPTPQPRKKIAPLSIEKKDISREIYIDRVSINPFEGQVDAEKKPPEPAKRHVIAAPRISLNPFWSDDEETEGTLPKPKPRVSKVPAEDKSPLWLTSTQLGGSSSSLARKSKKPAPKPPEAGPASLQSSPSHSVNQSPRLRKSKKAPPPPPTSTPHLQHDFSPMKAPRADLHLNFSPVEFEQEKNVKDEANRNKQNILTSPDKSTFGKWKRRKGLAPQRPIPQKRTIKELPLGEVKRELEVIEIQQQGLEKQGVRLEQIIREKCEGPGQNPDESLAPEVEDLVLQLFELVNEKNELFRKQAELMYLRRQQRLEEEHAEVEYQIRCLMLQPEANKTDTDKAREEELIARLVEIVERKNEIIQCLEMDRLREAEEDHSISNQLSLYSLKKSETQVSDGKKEKKPKKGKKEKKSKIKGNKVDADKDIDESEVSSTSSTGKEKKTKLKKKFNIF